MKTRILTLTLFLLFSIACGAGMITADPAPTETASSPAESPAASPQVASIEEENPAGAVYEIPEPTNPPRKCATVTATRSLHLRSDPDEKSEVLEYLYNGDQLRLIGRVGEWWKVTTSQGQTGYANSQYMEQSPCPQ